MQVVRERRVGGKAKGGEQRPSLAAEERCRVIMLVGREVRRHPLELERA
jgi:hypothetical protein